MDNSDSSEHSEAEGCYEDYIGFEQELLKEKERRAGYRHTVVKKVPSLYSRLQAIVWTFVSDERSSWLARGWALLNFIFIIFAIVVFIVQSWPSHFRSSQVHDTKWFLIDTVIVAVFTIDYVLRLLSAPDPVRFVRAPMSIIDLLTILPYFVGLIFYVSQTNASRRFLWIIVVLRVLRLLRVFRILRVGRFLHSVQAVASAMVRCLRPFLILLLMLGAGMVFFSTLLYYAEQLQEDFDRKEQEWIYNEHSNDPGKLSPFQSIPHTLWWCIVTMTTVGYGDTYPITPTGKLVAAFTMLIGILILAFPVGVLSVKFGEELLNEVSVKEEHRFLRTRQDLVTAARLRTLSQLLEKFNAELESARASSQSIASSQAAMAKQLDQYLYKFE